ncbi:MAG: cbb3-type cytochrome c oxidase subunit 3 [Proteobacteria bacterium]|nr:cbb3-type cytochrome c oxidase subunit 3 [Pseudomonadota bacterium]
MEMSDLRGLSTVFCMIAFLAVTYWAYGPSRKSYFEEAASLPFLEDEVQSKQKKDESS